MAGPSASAARSSILSPCRLVSPGARVGRLVPDGLECQFHTRLLVGRLLSLGLPVLGPDKPPSEGSPRIYSTTIAYDDDTREVLSFCLKYTRLLARADGTSSASARDNSLANQRFDGSHVHGYTTVEFIQCGELAAEAGSCCTQWEL